MTKRSAVQKQSERRLHKRVNINIWVREEKENYYYLYKATDISEGGIFLEKKIDVPNSQARSILKFTLPKSSRLITVAVDVIFSNTSTSHPYRPGSGIKFSNLTNQDRKLITKFIHQS